jgi:predicted PurR-regulated permease PerM
LPSGQALLAFILLILAGFAIVGFFTAPIIADQVDQLTQQVPHAVSELRTRLEQQAWSRALLDQIRPERLFSTGSAIAESAGSAFAATFGALGNIAILGIIGLFLAIDHPPTPRASAPCPRRNIDRMPEP